MLVTDGGQLIRTGVEDIRIAGRTTRGVTLFRVSDSERVVSVAHLADLEGEEEEADEAEAEAGSEPGADESGTTAPEADGGPQAPDEPQDQE